MNKTILLSTDKILAVTGWRDSLNWDQKNSSLINLKEIRVKNAERSCPCLHERLKGLTFAVFCEFNMHVLSVLIAPRARVSLGFLSDFCLMMDRATTRA